METFWFLHLRFRRFYDSAYDSDFHKVNKLSHDSDYDSVSTENQPLNHLATLPPVK